ncbi:MAG: hypothetical protein ACE5KX_00405 [Acidimicrobiia bacterium]
MLWASLGGAAAAGLLIGWLLKGWLAKRRLLMETKRWSARLAASQRSLDEALGGTSETQNRLTEVSEELASARVELETTSSRLHRMQEDLEAAEALTHLLQDESTERDKAIASLADDLADARASLELAKEDHKTLQHTLTGRDEEVRRLTARLAELEARAGVIVEREARIAELEGRLQNLTRLKDAEIARLQQQIAGLERLSSSLNERDAHISRVEEELKSVTSEKDGLTAALQRQVTKLQTLGETAAGLEGLGGQAAYPERYESRLADRDRRIQHQLQVLEEKEAQIALLARRAADLESRLRRPPGGGEEGSAPLPSIESPSDASAPDDLKHIWGIGPVIEQTLHTLGITAFSRIAEFTEEDIAWVEQALSAFPGRIRRDDWMASARELHLAKYGESP